jgi:hypothetical protein
MASVGSDQQSLAASTGGVIDADGAMLLSTDTTGETSLLFGPAALREVQVGVANGDFAIPPSDPTASISNANPLPYWTFTDNSAGQITCSIVADSAAGSGNVLRWTIAAGTTSSASAQITRYIPIPTSKNQGASIFPEVYVSSAFTGLGSGNVSIIMYYSYAKNDLTATGSGSSYSSSYAGLIKPLSPTTSLSVPADAAYVLIKIMAIVTTGTYTAGGTADISEVALIRGNDSIILSETLSPLTSAPAVLLQSGGVLTITPATSSAFTGSVTTTGSIGVAGATYGSTALTGPSFQLAGTTGAAWVFSNASGAADVLATNSTTRAGVLVTKSTAGQPSTVVNGTATTDAFADALRNGGLASDNTNGRFYVYNGSAWKYAALTTPSDSRLKEEITSIGGALDTLRQLIPVAFKWKRPEAHPRTDAVADDGKRLGFIADQVATTDLKHWVEDMGVGDIEHDLVADTDGRVLAVNIPQNEMEALVVQALLDIDTRLKALEAR